MTLDMLGRIAKNTLVKNGRRVQKNVVLRSPLEKGMRGFVTTLLLTQATLKELGIWPHCLRKAFRKVLNNSDVDKDTKDALMGHKLPGSRGNYFDSHDVDEIAKKYMRYNFKS